MVEWHLIEKNRRLRNYFGVRCSIVGDQENIFMDPKKSGRLVPLFVNLIHPPKNSSDEDQQSQRATRKTWELLALGRTLLIRRTT